MQPDRYLQSSDGSQLNRFNDIRANKMTAVRPDLNANYVQVGTHRSIACQYPLDSQLESHLHMLFDNRTPVLAVWLPPTKSPIPCSRCPTIFVRAANMGGIGKVRSQDEC
ncbi:hypothetical protein [Aeromonas veronii]|uniref:hypothetical protein n=1 Tax=Aeromonas veronii TaxID=654 RepID=UPI002AC88938|nr:hypothetical protein [Aeromonas veronii]